jgi:bacterioferritin (cytochrome b1)
MNRAEMIARLQRDLQNEHRHMQLYLYHVSSVFGLHAPEYREFFEKAAASEMQHIIAFQDRIIGLCGKAPVLTAGADFLPVVSHDPEVALDYAIALETEVARNYTLTLRELEATTYEEFPEAAYMKIFYEDQLKDSYEDCERMRTFRRSLGSIATRRPDLENWTLKFFEQ